MGKPYYCEYCDKSFKDEIQARKKHLASVQHQKLRSEHYHKFRDLATFLDEERVKKPCQRYTAPQGCVYGSICRFSHYTREQLQALEQKLKQKEEQKRLKNCPKLAAADLPGFMRKLEQNRATVAASSQIFWGYPDEAVRNLDLPPSMQKFDPTRLPSHPLPEWGC